MTQSFHVKGVSHFERDEVAFESLEELLNYVEEHGGEVRIHKSSRFLSDPPDWTTDFDR